MASNGELEQLREEAVFRAVRSVNDFNIHQSQERIAQALTSVACSMAYLIESERLSSEEQKRRDLEYRTVCHKCLHPQRSCVKCGGDV